MWGRGFGRGFGRGWGLGAWGYGRGFGRGFGFGARLGYCPWTGLPRGWRWGYGYPNTLYSYGYNYGSPYGISTSYAPQNVANLWQSGYNPVDTKATLENEAEFLKRRLDEITKRIEELEGK